jgi:hypothetical protein
MFSNQFATLRLPKHNSVTTPAGVASIAAAVRDHFASLAHDATQAALGLVYRAYETAFAELAAAPALHHALAMIAMAQAADPRFPYDLKHPQGVIAAAAECLAVIERTAPRCPPELREARLTQLANLERLAGSLHSCSVGALLFVAEATAPRLGADVLKFPSAARPRLH